MPEIDAADRPSESTANFWTNETSVLMTALWNWTPETWAAVGWSNDAGRSYRDNLLKKVTDPFITVVYVTANNGAKKSLHRQVVGFYLTSHETGDRDEFTDHSQWNRHPKKWRHSLRAVRAFRYVPEYRFSVNNLDPTLIKRIRAVGYWGELIVDPDIRDRLRNTPWEEVPVYGSRKQTPRAPENNQLPNMVKAGPASGQGYTVSEGVAHLPRQLYLLRLDGDPDALLGKPADGRSIYKVGLSISPELRREAFQKALPGDAYNWRVERTSKADGPGDLSFEAAVAGENAMKLYLSQCDGWLGGEFYLASKGQIEEAWDSGLSAAECEIRSFSKNQRACILAETAREGDL